MNVFIYYLSNISGEIRYIGKTKNHPRKRLYNHILESNGSSISHKNNWIKSLLDKGEKPIIEVIDEIPESEWEFWEQYWISQFKCWGFRLTNISPGGYNNNYSRSYETKQKMRKSKLGNKLSKEHKEKISNSVKQKAKENPNYNRSGNNIKNIIDRDLLYNLYIIENLSLNKIAKKLGYGKKKIFDSLSDYNIKKSKESWKHQLISNPKKVVLQYDLKDNFIKEFESLSEASSYTNAKNISSCCLGKCKSSGGYIWKYKNID